jgi:hypothetical protein
MKQFTVEMVCKVRKSVTVECDTEEQARKEPWEYATDETEIDQIDWEVMFVREDK